MEWLAFRMVPRSAKDLTKPTTGKGTSLEHHIPGESVLPPCLCEDLFYELQIGEVAEILVKIPSVSDREGWQPFQLNAQEIQKLGRYYRYYVVQWNFGAQDRPWAEQTIPRLAERVGKLQLFMSKICKKLKDSKILRFPLVWPLGLCAHWAPCCVIQSLGFGKKNSTIILVTSTWNFMVGPWGTRPTHIYLTRCRNHELDKNRRYQNAEMYQQVSTSTESTVTGHRSSRFRASKKTTLLQFFSSQIWTRCPCQESLFATAGCKQDVDITHQHVSVKEVKHATICLINLLEIGSFLKFRFLAMHKTLPSGDFQHLSTFSKAGKAWLFCGEASSSEYHRTDVETSAQTTLWDPWDGIRQFQPCLAVTPRLQKTRLRCLFRHLVSFWIYLQEKMQMEKSCFTRETQQ